VGHIIRSLHVSLSSLAVEKNGISQNITTFRGNPSVLLDSGASLSYLPSDMVSQVLQALGSTSSTDPLSDDDLTVDCEVGSKDISLEFGFGDVNGPVIQVPIRSLVATPDDTPTIDGGSNQCLLLLAIGFDGDYVLGDSFLRSAYVVFDLDNNKVSLAQTRYNVTTSNIVEIPKGPNGLASILSSAAPSSATATGSSVHSAASGLIVPWLRGTVALMAAVLSTAWFPNDWGAVIHNF
jgi:Eukaryotic aspartyl protease